MAPELFEQGDRPWSPTVARAEGEDALPLEGEAGEPPSDFEPSGMWVFSDGVLQVVQEPVPAAEPAAEPEPEPIRVELVIAEPEPEPVEAAIAEPGPERVALVVAEPEPAPVEAEIAEPEHVEPMAAGPEPEPESARSLLPDAEAVEPEPVLLVPDEAVPSVFEPVTPVAGGNLVLPELDGLPEPDAPEFDGAAEGAWSAPCDIK